MPAVPSSLARGAALLCVALLAGCSTTAPAPLVETPEPVRRALGAPTPLPANEVYVEQAISAMSLEQKVASLVMVHVPGTDPARIRSVVEAHDLGGVILMGDNLPGSARATAALTAALHADPGLPILTAIDQEGGIVRRLPDAGPAAGALWDAPPSAAEAAFAARGALVAEAGVLINFGIVADVSPDGASYIRSRTLGPTPSAAAERVAAAVRGEQGSALSTLKHFPGHGASPDDSHVSIPRSSMDAATWRATHALPFAAGIDAGAELVMTGHLRFDAISPLPASLSPTWIRMLRDELGFEGVIVTDDLLMLQRSGETAYADPVRNAVRALAAGNDLLLFVLPADPRTVGVDLRALIAALAGAVDDGRIAEQHVDAAVRRVLSLRREASGLTAPLVACGLKCAGALEDGGATGGSTTDGEARG